jgi:phage tail-like protein
MPDEEIYRAYSFKLDIQGVTAAYFTEVSGLGVKVEAIEYRAGGDAPWVRRLPGWAKVGEVSLRYGLSKTNSLWDWFKEGLEGKTTRKDVSIILLGTDGVQEMTRWNLFRSWLTDWRAAKLDAMAPAVAIETMTLVADELKRAD